MDYIDRNKIIEERRKEGRRGGRNHKVKLYQVIETLA